MGLLASCWQSEGLQSSKWCCPVFMQTRCVSCQGLSKRAPPYLKRWLVLMLHSYMEPYGTCIDVCHGARLGSVGMSTLMSGSCPLH